MLSQWSLEDEVIQALRLCLPGLLVLLPAVSWPFIYALSHDPPSPITTSHVCVTEIPRNPLVLASRAMPGGDSSLSEPNFKEKATTAQTSAQISGAFGEVILVCG